MSDPTERREPSRELERGVDQLDAKVDRVGDQVENVGKEMRTALEALMKQQDDRWKWFEQRSDMDSRNQKQAIELLTASVVRLQQDVASAETQVQLVATDQRVLSTKLYEQKVGADQVHDELKRRIDGMDESLKWARRVSIAAVSPSSPR